jgi:hypothetical protein
MMSKKGKKMKNSLGVLRIHPFQRREAESEGVQFVS